MFKIIEKAAGLIEKLGVESYDIYAVEGVGTSVEVKEREVNRIKSSITKGLAIRLVSEGRLGFAYTNDVSDDGVRIAIECAKENAKISEPDEYAFSMPQKLSLIHI
jgi:PmbA protein